jgi:hypothetical protein
MKKSKSLGYYKKKAWKAFSDFIRTRDSLSTTKSTEKCRCVTCGKTVDFSEIQAGHAIAGRHNSILFDTELVNGQCSGCNGYGGGKYAEYSLWFINKYGLEEWEEKVALSKQLIQYKESDYIRICEEYKDKLDLLLKDNYELLT